MIRHTSYIHIYKIEISNFYKIPIVVNIIKTCFFLIDVNNFHIKVMLVA